MSDLRESGVAAVEGECHRDEQNHRLFISREDGVQTPKHAGQTTSSRRRGSLENSGFRQQLSIHSITIVVLSRS